MCVISNVGDQWGRDRDKWPNTYPPTPRPGILPYIPLEPLVTRKEFDELKQQVENLVKMLKLAKAIDKAQGTPDCEMAEKLAFLRKAAEMVGIDLDEVLNET